jgi:SAM-dependent methyltransferase
VSEREERHGSGPLTALEELSARSVMQAGMWEDLAQLPTWHAWDVLRQNFLAAIHDDFARWIGVHQAHFREQLVFALGRFDEGAGLVRYLELTGHSGLANVLDIGAGNGGVAFAIANCRQYSVHTLDIVPNAQLRTLRGALNLPVRSVVAVGERIPLAAASMDIILLLDTLEHLSDPRAVAAEIMRVLRPGGVCMLTTPARLRHVFGPDPHYGIRSLVIFPNAVQRRIVNDIARRRVRGEQGIERPAYDVEHLFWHVREVSRLFPGPKNVEVLYERTFRPPPSIWHIRHPRTLAEWIAYHSREFFWDRIVITKQ